jgi:hypothetical protein
MTDKAVEGSFYLGFASSRTLYKELKAVIAASGVSTCALCSEVFGRYNRSALLDYCQSDCCSALCFMQQVIWFCCFRPRRWQQVKNYSVALLSCSWCTSKSEVTSGAWCVVQCSRSTVGRICTVHKLFVEATKFFEVE